MYEVLKNRLTNSEPFIIQSAKERINALANNLEITQQQAEELTSLAEERGVNSLPLDYKGRLEFLERENRELREALDLILSGGTN